MIFSWWLFLTGRPWPEKVEVDTSVAKFFKAPKTNWRYMPTGTPELVFYMVTAPNIFHRILQRFCFGVRWKRT
jgi:hypothetical protein